VKRIRVPLSVVLVLLVVAAVGRIQGLRAASVRHARLQPARASTGTLAPGDSVAVLAHGLRFAVVALGDPPPARVALLQWMPARTLVRWIEEPVRDAATPQLVIPLEGLQPGDYAVCVAADAFAAGPREMDRPPDDLDVITRFRVPSPPARH
jgi:hypothetical protein